MADQPTEKRPYNLIVRVGMWVTVGTAVAWAAGETYKVVESVMPWALGVGIATLALGLFKQFKGEKPTS